MSLLTPAEAASELRVSRGTLLRLVGEGLPAHELCRGPQGRRVLRFRASEIEAWLEGRRERQLSDWSRYARGRE